MPAGISVFPGQSNTYVKDFRSSGKLQVSFSRNPRDFALPNYIQYVPVKRDQGYYLVINAEQAARLVGGDLDEFVWPDGADRPMNHDGTEKFNFSDYRTIRRNYGFVIGDKASSQADWNIMDTEATFHAQQAMTARTRMVNKVLSNPANWDAAHTMNVASIPGNSGAWDVSTTARQDIKRSLNYGSQVILKATLGKVRKRDMVLVMNPDTASQISETQEIVDHIKGSPEAYSQVKGGEGKWSEFGLPDKLYNFHIVVEDAVMVTSIRNAATVTRSYVMDSGVVYLMSRPGGLEPVSGGPNFSTCCLFLYEDMTVETLKDTNNRRASGNVVDDFTSVLTAPASGFMFQGVVT
jgi:hypothetical protein